MLLAPTTAPTRPAPIAAPTTTSVSSIRTGDVLGTARVQIVEPGSTRARLSGPMDITVGAVLARGVTDIAAAAHEFIGDHWHDGPRRTTGLVAFIRNGDAFDAVEMLAPTRRDGSAPQRVWAPWNLDGFRATAGIDIAAVWQISGYGFDAGYGRTGSSFPG